MTTRWGRAALVQLLVAGLLVAACSGGDDPSSEEGTGNGGGDDSDEGDGPESTTTPAEPLHHGSYAALIPRPTELAPGEGELVLVGATNVVVDLGAHDLGAPAAAELLRGYVAPATGLELPTLAAGGPGDAAADGPTIRFAAASAAGAAALGEEGYELAITADGAEISAAGAAGFGWAVQTIRQLLAPEAESPTVQGGTFTLPAVTIRDVPRYPWRGAMLDVARHFFPPEDVQRVIDLMALYKLNRLHLHLTDDQGWRLQIQAYPELTEIGAATETGGGPGGFYTQDQYRELVAYAADRSITVVPEIDTPGHTAAALASLPGLACAGVPPTVVNTGFSDGRSSLCATDEGTYAFLREVIAEIAALTPGPYIHLGADEAHATSAGDFRRFLTEATQIVLAEGKQPIGWDEIATAGLGSDTTVQFWLDEGNARAAAEQGASLIMSPSAHAYLDMKYDDTTELGLTWAGPTNTRDAYEWDPATVVGGIPPELILGVEAPLWTETLTDLAQVEQMLLPRLPGLAEIGWSPVEGRTWDEYAGRLAAHPARWTASGRTYTPDPIAFG